MSSNELPTSAIAPVELSGRRLVVSMDGRLVFVELPPRGRLVVGRSHEADIVLDHPSISRKHVALEIAEDVRVEDLGSANGSTLAGQRLLPSAPGVLTPGIVLELGVVIVTLQDGRAVPADSPPTVAGVVIDDPAMVELHETVRIAAGSSLSVLLLGETGVGKELFARRVHELSPRAQGPLVRVNCAALVESLLEAELFGYERGAFTGATQAKPGLLEAASGGTLFLDELGELPLPTQAKLLRVLENGEVLRVGALKPRTVDVRFVSATHRNLEELVATARFREDLFFRLDGVSIRIPPLRERKREIVPLALAFIEAAARSAGRPAPTLAADARQCLVERPWSGNVRELLNVIRRSVLFCAGPTLTAAELRFEALGAGRPSAPAPVVAAPVVAAPVVAAPAALLNESPERTERRHRVIEALEKTVWNQTRAAELLGISRRTLQSWMIDLQVPRPRGSR